MKNLTAILLIAVPAAAFSQTDATLTIDQVAADVAAKVAEVKSFSATVETGELLEDEPGSTDSSSLLVSKQFGWKMLGKSEGKAMQLVTDYNTFYQYFPKDAKVFKTTADRPEIKAMLTKPATDMNPINIMSPDSRRLEGVEEFEGETVYHVTGTTESQMMPGGPLVKRTISALISAKDGLPRKTMEGIGMSTGTTVYHNVKLNPPVSPLDFQFNVPDAVTVIDTNERVQRMEAEIKAAPSAKKP